MEKQAFKMRLKPGSKEAYVKIHKEIWPEVLELLKQNGVSDYTIFLDEETNTLFAVQKVADKSLLKNLPASPIIQRWWDSLADLMDVNPNNSPVITKLEQIFHLD
jgi:L-rhamnose mutarotase